MRAIVGLLLVAACAGCAVLRPVATAVDHRELHHVEIHTDTVWSGRVIIDGWVKVFKGATLTILPGTDVTFIPRDEDRERLFQLVGAQLAAGIEAPLVETRHDDTKRRLVLRMISSKDVLP